MTYQDQREECPRQRKKQVSGHKAELAFVCSEETKQTKGGYNSMSEGKVAPDEGLEVMPGFGL